MGLNHGTNIVKDGLIFYMDAANLRSYPGSGTTVTNLKNSSITGTMNGTTFSSINNGVLDFDGTDDYIEIPDNTVLEPAENITVSCWVNLTNGGHINGYYVSKVHTAGSSASYGIFKKQPYFFIQKSSGYVNSPQYGSSIVDAGWTHLVGTYDGSYARFYVNGIEVGNGTAGSGAIDYTAEKAYIGAFDYYTPTSQVLLPVEGKISNVQIYNRALSAQEITQNYNALKSRFGL